ncbi:tetratricopeptide repeat protein [Chloroflexi bacterium TSY]|nr:tetratricopeptide repeat protein [Chloroflexi bacterium TSY]
MDLLKLGDRWGMLECSFIMGRTAEQGGQLIEAEKYLQAGLSICLAIGERLDRAYVYDILARIAIMRGAYGQAKTHLDEEMKIRQEFDDSLGLIAALTMAGRLAIEQGNYTQAVQYLQKSHAMHDELGIVRDLDNLYSLGFVRRLLGDHEASERLLTRSLDESRDIGQPWRIALSLSSLACLNYDRQQFHQAERHLQEALALWEQLGNEPEMASVLRHLGRVLIAVGESRQEEVRQSSARALQLALKHGLAPIALDIFVSVTGLLMQIGEIRSAIELLTLSEHHAASTCETKEKAHQQLAELTAGLSSNVVTTAQKRGQALDWRETAQRLIEALSNPAWGIPHPAIPNNLHTQSTPFVGREQELSVITRRLQEPDCRLITLVGPGGIGKTRLAIATAERLLAPPTNQQTSKPSPTASSLYHSSQSVRPAASFLRLPKRPTSSSIAMCHLKSSYSTIYAKNKCCWCWTTLNICWWVSIWWPTLWRRHRV